MTGTVGEHREQNYLGECRAITSYPGARQLRHSDEIHSNLAKLIVAHEKQLEIECNHILSFHVGLDELRSFEDGNNRMGSLLMFNECSHHDVMPVIIDDNRCSLYSAHQRMTR